MRHLKRMIAFIAMLAMSVACVGPAYAANAANGTQESPTLAMYAVYLDPGDNKGELDITFDVTATKKADSLGVSYFEIHRASDDGLVDTVYGSVENGLRKNSSSTYANTYTYSSVTSGAYYYIVIAVSARIGTTYDSRTLRTVSVKAP